jgi:hypothetical protein
MPRDPKNPLNLSGRFQDAVDVVSALGEPEQHFKDSGSDWGDEEDDYVEEKKSNSGSDSRNETESYYDTVRRNTIKIVE